MKKYIKNVKRPNSWKNNANPFPYTLTNIALRKQKNKKKSYVLLGFSFSLEHSTGQSQL